MPYINVDEAYVLDNTGVQVDNAVDYALYNSNRNLLDNPWWGSGEVINQRGQTTLTTNATYFVDRWKSQIDAGSSLDLTSDGIKFTRSTNTYVGLYQVVPLMASLVGKVSAASVLLSDGTIVSGSGTLTASGTTNYTSTSDAIAITATPTNSRLYVRNYGNTVTVRAVKLELGAYSTLLNDVAPNYEEELAKCQHYFLRLYPNSSAIRPIGLGIANLTSHCSVLVPTPVTMRTVSSVAMNSTFSLYGNGSSYSVSSMSVSNTHNNGVILDCSSSGLTANHIYGLTSTSLTSYIDFNADL